MTNIEKSMIEQLYQLLDRAEKEEDNSSSAALHWAIFTLESQV